MCIIVEVDAQVPRSTPPDITRKQTMKAVILAGGYGTRLSEETTTKPKPMIEIGGQPILWHIMKIYSHYGINEFIICLGYKGHIIKEYFSRYYLNNSDLTFDLANNSMQVHQSNAEPWKVTLVDTGEDTLTGGRIKRIASYLDEEDFCLTYGDGVGDIDIGKLIETHQQNDGLATLTAVSPPGRFGALQFEGDRITSFKEKKDNQQTWINGGFFILSPKVIDYISGDDCMWEGAPLEKLADEGQLNAYRHTGFWHPMDTLANKKHLEGLWNSGSAPWKLW
jgi:glucose-1-phosphate cytidylyltransferase